jgi:hypothetical protein
VNEPTQAADLELSPPADMHYTDDTDVARVLVRVEYKDGRIREYEAREPHDFKMDDPASFASMAVEATRLSLGASGGFRALRQAVPTVRLSFKANPRWNLHIRTERTAEPAEREPQPVVLQGEVSDETGEAEPTRLEHDEPPPALPALHEPGHQRPVLRPTP